MNCPGCGVEIVDDSRHCPRCGRALRDRASVQLDFGGAAIDLLGWILLTIVASLALVPLAWVQAAIGRWICRNLKFSDGTTATFRGTGGQVVGWVILYVVVVVAFQIASARAVEAGPWLMLFGAYVLCIAGVAREMLRWFVANVVFGSGPRLVFVGTYGEFLGWYVLLCVSIFTIVGWAWATAGMYRWIARNTHGDNIEFQFDGEGLQILWRTFVLTLASLLVIPIPWVTLWLMRWIVQNISFKRSAGAAAAA